MAATAEKNGAKRSDDIEKAVLEREAIEVVPARITPVLVVAIVQ